MPVLFILGALLWASAGIIAARSGIGVILFMVCAVMVLVCVELFAEWRDRQ